MIDSTAFFDTQFRHQIETQEFVLNPFEQAALPYLKGDELEQRFAGWDVQFF
ncbi:MAG: hypothetical protein KGZ31_03630 [Sulfuritalea sp.]|nr:hypothetical protein [Sulfuritalea sp.]